MVVVVAAAVVAVVAVVGVVVMDRNMLNPIPLMKGVGLVEHRNTKCIFGGLGGRGGVGAWGGGANNVQLQLHTYLMLC